MSLASQTLDQLEHAGRPEADALPPAAHHFAPRTPAEAAQVLAAATDERAVVMFHGAGTRQGMGGDVEPDVVISTSRMDSIIRWEPDDLTLVVESGAQVRTVEDRLREKGQTAGLPEWDRAGSIGGVVAAGASGYRRARLGPTRDRMLEVSMITGDGRMVKGGGRVVKNVSGYDLPRLATGSMGRLGMIVSVCLKLWPLPESSATVSLSDPSRVWQSLYRPLAVLETERGSWAYLQGTDAEVRSQIGRIDGENRDGLHWPHPPAGPFACSLRVRPTDVSAAIERLGVGWRFVAQHGVGVVDAATDDPDPGQVASIRSWAEERDGSLVIVEPGPVELDPWGTPPAALDLQRRIVTAFDPYGVCNPGRLPGGI